MLCFGGDDVLGDPTAGKTSRKSRLDRVQYGMSFMKLNGTIGRPKSAHGLSMAATVILRSVHGNRGIPLLGD